MSRNTSIGELAALGALQFGDGYRTKRSEHGQPGYRIIRVADVMDDAVSFEGPDFVSADYVRAIGTKLGHPGDILLTTKGTVGRVAVLPETGEQVVYSPQLCYFRVLDFDVIAPRFLRYWFSSQEFWLQAADRMNNTDMAAYINLADIRSLKMTLPSIHNQQAIAEVLGALDDKIAANTTLLATLDSLRRARFHSMLNKEVLELPLSGTAEFVNGKAFTKNASGTGRVVIRIAELNSGLGGSTIYNDIEVGERHLARPGDILFAWSGSLTLHRWYRDEGIINQHIFKVIPNAGFPHWLAYELIQNKLDAFKSIAADKATTMGHIQRRHLDEPVRVPSERSVKTNNEAMEALWKRSLLAERESLELATTRDALLPQLMSGKLRVKDAEKLLVEAGV
ncbi:restriction endonuclease subunit S [Arthrobacter sp. AL08]|uniref:restriction endonuclease subunit S n=1 Tax=unclassified Arthrobacter TaxID=235627 RepID=UPI00249C3D0A|nr:MULTISPECIES: restriction endonuclease subunit S [unclassified Arthrobacter]MDI3242334.1 restriction endonuclease subunit S [Arthrobacter sp. AL05]MDI3278344.1 restriction endonuclease subunit S [Arthrobacter sp. AL08]